MALALAGLGEVDEAVHWLEPVYRDHSFWLTFWGNVVSTCCVTTRDPTP